MMILRKGMLIAVVMLVTVVMQFINGDNAFIDDPPDGYFSRTSLDGNYIRVD